MSFHLPSVEEIQKRCPKIGNDAKLHDYVFNIKQYDLKEIKKFVNKNYWKQPDFLVLYIVKMSTLRSENIDLYVDVIYEFVMKTGHKISPFVLSRVNIVFIRKLFEKGLFTSEDIKGIFYGGTHISNFPMKEYLDLNFKVTYPEYKKGDIENTSYVPINDDYTQYGYTKDSIEYILKNDLVDQLPQKYLEKKNQKLYVNCLDSGRSYYELDCISFAAFYGSYKCFKYLVDSGADYDNTTCRNAVRGGNMDIIMFLQSKGMSFNDCLKAANMYNRNDIFEWLVNNGFATPTAQNPPLYECIKFGNIQIAYYMVVNFKCVDDKDSRDRRSVHFGSRFSSMEFYDWLVNDNGAIYNNHCTRFLLPLHNACRFGRFDIVKFLVQKYKEDGLNPKKYIADAKLGRSCVHCAAWSGNIELFKYVAEMAPECINEADGRFGMTPLYCALIANQIDIVKLIINEFHGNVNEIDGGLFGENISRLVTAAKANYGEIVRFLLAKGANPNIETYSGKNPLLYASNHSNYYMMYLLLKKGNKQNGAELIRAAHSVTTMKWLLKRGSKFILTNDHEEGNSKKPKMNALHFAAIYGTIEEIKFLLEHHFDINSRDINMRTPIYRAVFIPEVIDLGFLEKTKDEEWNARAFDNVKFMIEWGSRPNAKEEDKVDINAVDCDNRNILWPAVKSQNEELIRYLLTDDLTKNINYRLIDANDETLYDYMISRQLHLKVIEEIFPERCHNEEEEDDENSSF